MHSIRLIVAKDIALHMANGGALLGGIMMSVTVYMIARLSVADEAMVGIAAGSYWTAFFLSGYLSLNRIFLLENQHRSFHAVLISGAGSLNLFAASSISMLLFFTVLQAVSLPLHALFFNVDWSLLTLGNFLIVFLLTSVGFNAVILCVGQLVSEARFSEFLLPLLCFPLQIPLLLASVSLSSILMQGGEIDLLSNWGKLLIAYDCIFIVVGYILFVAIYE